MRSDGFWWHTRYLAFTSQRVIVLEESAFLKGGHIEQQLPWSDVRSVSKVVGSDRNDGFNLQILYSDGEGRRDFPMRGDLLTHRGDEVLQLLSGHTCAHPPSTEDADRPAIAISSNQRPSR
jgi:hypothetical protein